MKLTDLLQSTKKRKEFCSDHNENCGNDCVGCERYDSELAAIANAVVMLEEQDLIKHYNDHDAFNNKPSKDCPACALLKEAREVVK